MVKELAKLGGKLFIEFLENSIVGVRENWLVTGPILHPKIRVLSSKPSRRRWKT